MTDTLSINDARLQALTSAIEKLGNHNTHWDYTTAIPTFLGALLGFLTALLLDWLKTQREKSNLVRDRREKELAQLNAVNVMLAFNMETLVHTAEQQILPHYDGSTNALKTVEDVLNNQSASGHFQYRLNVQIGKAMRRCPEPNLMEFVSFTELSPLLKPDPNLIKVFGWITTFTRDLKAIIKEQNKLIDRATLNGPQEGLDLASLKLHLESQVHVSVVAVVYCHQLIEHLTKASGSLTDIISKHYHDVPGPKLTSQHPEILSQVREALRQLAVAHGAT